MIRIVPFDDVVTELARVLEALGFSQARARQSATLFAETHRDGVASHGLNRFPRFVRQIKAGVVRPAAEPVCAAQFGPWEQWDGQLGPGNLNATAATDRAVALAKDAWHRAGGAAQHEPLDARRHLRMAGRSRGRGVHRLDQHHAQHAAVGHRLVQARQHAGHHRHPAGDAPMVLDVAMSQFSYGKMETLQLRGQQLPLPGGFDEKGRLTTDPGAILKTMRPLPTGYWKGAGLSLVFDVLGAVLSGGQTSHEIGRQPDEFGLSQIFLALDVGRPAGADAVSRVVSCGHRRPAHGRARRRRQRGALPGEQVLKTRAENARLGIPVDDAVWEAIRAMP